MSNNPRGHTLGIIGLGAIGSLIAQKSHLALGLKIHYHDIVRKPALESPSSLAAIYHDSLPSLLAVSDCVVLATPAIPNGKKLITAETLKHFKKGSRFVNIARGSLVDSEAVADTVEEGRLVAVALDVHEDEPNVNERLKGMREVTLTAHNAGGTLETYVYSHTCPF